jgi:hypothetical protein
MRCIAFVVMAQGVCVIVGRRYATGFARPHFFPAYEHGDIDGL